MSNEKMPWPLPNIATWLTEKSPEVDWLIPNFIPSDSLVLLSGHQKTTRKTLLAMHMAFALATGTKLGKIAPARAAPVLFVEEEGAAAETRQRIIKVCRGLGIDPEKLTNVAWAFRQRVKLDTPSWQARLLSYVKEYKPALVVLDALTYMHVADENANKEMLVVVDTLHALRSLGCSVLFLVHLDKFGSKDRTVDIDAQIRGATVVVNAYDVHIAVRQFAKAGTPYPMTVRARDYAETNYTVHWKFNDSGAHLNLTSPNDIPDEDAEAPKPWQSELNRLTRGQTYHIGRLAQIWGVKIDRARKIVEDLLEMRHIIPIAEDVWMLS